MRRLPALLVLTALLVACVVSPPSHAQAADPGVESAMYLLKDAARPQRDGSHNALLLGLRRLEDPDLLPLFRGLSGSPYLSMRVHGQLGAAALSPQKRIDLAALAEIEDQNELVQVLSAAIDDNLIDNKQMATLLTWDGLELPLRQAIALRLLGAGGKVDVEPFRESLKVELDESLSAAKTLQYALAAVLLAESGDAEGRAALKSLAGLQNESSEAVIGQTLDAAMRNNFASTGALGLAVAKDKQCDPSLRLLAIQSAMRLETPGAAEVWQDMFRSEQDSAQRIRLAMIALDSAEHVAPTLFDTLADSGEWVGHIAKAGQAIASKEADLAKAFEPLIDTGQPLSVQWVVTYCQRSQPAQGPALLELVIRSHDKAARHHQGRVIQTGVAATTALCELYPDEANQRLATLLDVNQPRPSGIDDGIYLTRRQIMLMGIARARSQSLKPLAASLQPDDLGDFTTEALRLFIRARHGEILTAKEWEHISDIIQGVGQFDRAMRLQMGWAYLKHKGVAEKSIQQVLR